MGLTYVDTYRFETNYLMFGARIIGGWKQGLVCTATRLKEKYCFSGLRTEVESLLTEFAGCTFNRSRRGGRKTRT